ncbi:MAG: transposase [Pseudomonadota bacterium]
MDKTTGESFEHRREWVEKRLLAVSSVFSIDVASFAIMSNHYHVVLHVDTSTAAEWTDIDVIKRWHRLFNGSLLSRKFLDCPNLLSPGEIGYVRELANQWRHRLTDISWFMRCVNEPISRQANAEDRCTGAFWEGRFKSQALLDEKAILAAMAYVDLNPIRAEMATTPDDSDHTSIQRRVAAAREGRVPQELMCFQVRSHDDKPSAIPCSLEHYVKLLDWTGRAVQSGTRGAIDDGQPPLLHRIKMDAAKWLAVATEFEDQFRQWVGTDIAIQTAARNVGKTRSRSPPLIAA